MCSSKGLKRCNCSGADTRELISEMDEDSVASAELLSTEDIASYMASWPKWELINDGTAILRHVQIATHLSTVAFVQAAVEMGDVHDHQPDIQIQARQRLLSLTLSTESEGTIGLSSLDFLVAECIDQIPVDTC